MNRQRQTLKPLKTLGFSVCPYYTVRAHLRYHGPAERCGCENSILHAGPLRRRFHPTDLHPRHSPETGRGSRRHGQFYGTGPVRTERKMRRTGSPSSCPALLCPLVPLSHFRVWVTVWVRNFWPTRKVTFCNKKSPKTEVFGDFWSCYPDSNWGPHPYQGCALPTEL